MNGLKITLGILLFALLAIPLGASAQTVADVANSIKTNIQGLPNLIGVICYVFGVGCGVMAAIKLKEHNETKGQTKMFIPIAYAIGAAFLLAMPTVMNVGMGTFGYSKTQKYGNY